MTGKVNTYGELDASLTIKPAKLGCRKTPKVNVYGGGKF